MKLSKAIEILEDLQHGLDLPLMADCDDALRLGIEALRVVQSNRIYGYPNKIPKLPGETTE
ncbi:hypothetical protein LCGC14_1218610 [marine sediment metagenome]|uniref:Uncharacterized protein n=1 Tax=marine sediment metagenome TaxID=412755 RepID=A0A0F9LFZ7_9ZZZZ